MLNHQLAVAAPIHEEIHVSNLDELKKVLDQKPSIIYLDSDIDFPNNNSSNIPINDSVTIDGQNHTITNEGTISSSHGFYFNSDNIALTMKNINFGNQNLDKSFSNYWGIAYGKKSQRNLSLNLENISYFSRYYAQPLYVEGDTNSVNFTGNNTFVQKSGTGTQEWAEGSNFNFKQGSNTKIEHNTSEEGGFIWSQYPLNFNVQNDAHVEIETNHYFSWGDSSNNNISLGDNSTLSINDIVYPLTRYNYSYDFTIGKNSHLTLTTKRSSSSGDFNGTFKFNENSVGEFKTESPSFFNKASGIKFELNNPKTITFESTIKTATSTNPIGLNANSNFSFSNFAPNVAGYDIISDDMQVDEQLTPDSWNVLSGDISRNNKDFSASTKEKLSKSHKIHLDQLAYLSFDSNGGQPIKNQKSIPLKVGTAINLNELSWLIKPIWSNHTFMGWSTVKDLPTSKIDTIIVPPGGMDLYALWQPNYVEIKTLPNLYFPKQVINGHNIVCADLPLTIQDNLPPTRDSGWKLFVKYDGKNEHWDTENLNLSFLPSTTSKFINCSPKRIVVNSSNQLLAHVQNESLKDKNIQVLDLHPQLRILNDVPPGQYQAILDWYLTDTPE